jgi:hypothetical protein
MGLGVRRYIHRFEQLCIFPFIASCLVFFLFKPLRVAVFCICFALAGAPEAGPP